MNHRLHCQLLPYGTKAKKPHDKIVNCEPVQMQLNEKLINLVNAKELEYTPIAINNLQSIGVHIHRFLKDVYFEKNVAINSPFIEMGKSKSFFGAYTYINDGGLIRGPIYIGRYCSVGRRVSISAGQHPLERVSTSTHPLFFNTESRSYNETESQLVRSSFSTETPWTIIHNDVWIGDGAVILPGISIGTGAVIGANAVVTKSVPPYAIVGGVPARLIRYRFPPNIAQKLLESAWWEKDEDTISKIPMGNVFDFIKKSRRHHSVNASMRHIDSTTKQSGAQPIPPSIAC